MKTKVFSFLTILAVLISTVAPFTAQTAAAGIPPIDIGQEAPPAPTEADSVDSDASTDAASQRVQKALSQTSPAYNQVRQVGRVIGEDAPESQELARYIVQLTDAPLATYLGGLPGLSATSPRATGATKLDPRDAAAVAYESYLDRTRDAVISTMNQTVGRQAEILFTYETAFNGFTAELTPQEAVQIAKLQGVKMVQKDFMRELMTDVGPGWIGAGSIWDGSSTAGLPGTRGEGLVVGIIDSGINMDNPSFAALSGDGYIHSNPRGKYYGVCDPNSDVYNTAYSCNDKLIGAWDFSDEFETPDGPEDNDGHGSHTASTVAGNVVNAASLYAPTYVFQAAISGVAPRANIIAYDGCALEGCPGSALIASIDQATKDQVDVINYSIGGGSSNPWNDADSQAFLAAIEAGVLPVTSAGNSGPGAATIGSPADAPWMFSIGAATHTRKANNSLTISDENGELATYLGASLTGSYGPAPIVYAGNYTNTNGYDPLCLDPYPAGTFSGEIVVCDRGIAGRVAKGANVKAGGAGGYILANDEANGDSLSSDSHALPGVHISYMDGIALKDYISNTTTLTGTIAGTTIVITDSNADITAGFSSRGPSASVPGVIKPDVTAPGVDIFAAYKNGEEFYMISGTSMSSPHVAGAAALLRDLYPSWSPMAIRSALMLTADTTVTKEDGTTQADAFDMGGGRIDLTQAAKVGFVLDESATNFQAADPSMGGDPTTLNVASLGDDNCVNTCTWTRTISSTQSGPVDYMVSVSGGVTMTASPSSFTLPAGGTQVISFTADITGAEFGTWLFGQVDITPMAPSRQGMDVAPAHMPVAVYPSPGEIPASVEIETNLTQGSYLLTDLALVDTANLVTTFLLAEPTTIESTVSQDPTNGDAYDTLSDVYTTTVNVPADGKKMIVQISASSAPDLDLFVGLDTNGNGQPDASEELCSSTTASFTELCELSGEDLESGTYWVLVQNWQASSSTANDTFAMDISILTDSDSGPGFTGDVPSSASFGTSFEARVNWNLPNLAPGALRAGLIEMTDGDTGMTLGTIDVSLARLTNLVSRSVSAAPGDANGLIEPGEEVVFDVLVQPDLAANAEGNGSYVMTDTLPAGLTYVADSASANVGEPTVNGNQLVWNVNSSGSRYVMSTNATNPSCATPFGPYVNLAGFGLAANPAVSGDNFATSIDDLYGGSDPFNFFGTDYNQAFFTDNGFVTFANDAPELGATPGVHQSLPTAGLPNNLAAVLWRDFEVVYDQETNRGVTVAGAGGGSLMIVEYDDIEPAPAGSTNERYDIEVTLLRDVDDSPNSPEIVLSFGSMSNAPITGTVGLENADGTIGVQYAKDGSAPIVPGLAVCYDWTDKIEFSYKVQVDEAPASTTLTSTLSTSLDQPNASVEPVDTVIEVADIVLSIQHEGPAITAVSPFTHTLTISNSGTSTATNLTVEASVPAGTQWVSGGSLGENGVVSWTIPSLAGNSSTQLFLAVEPAPNAGIDPQESRANVSPRTTDIVGGIPADVGEYPYQVALTSNTGVQFCGGSLVDTDWVLTSADCVSGESLSSMLIFAGVHDLSTDLTSGAAQARRASQIVMHPNYNSNTNDYDVALLRLSQPVVLTDTAQTISMATLSDSMLFDTGTLAKATGWGGLAEGEAGPDVLHEVTLPIYDQAICNEAITNALGIPVTSMMICAGYEEGGKDTCQGDSGGPLAVRDGDSNWLQVGITSFGEGCARPGLPGVYASVPALYNWIMGPGSNTYPGPSFSISDGSGRPGQSFSGSAASSGATTVGQFFKIYGPLIQGE